MESTGIITWFIDRKFHFSFFCVFGGMQLNFYLGQDRSITRYRHIERFWTFIERIKWSNFSLCTMNSLWRWIFSFEFWCFEPILFYLKGAGLFEQRSINIGILGIVFRTKLVIIERGTMKIVILTQILHFRLGPSFDSVHLLWIISPSDGNSAIISAIMRFEVLISLDLHSFYSNRLCWDWHNIPNWRHLHI